MDSLKNKSDKELKKIRTNLEKVRTEVNECIEVLSSALEEDDLIRAKHIKAQLDYMNLLRYENTDEYKNLSKFDRLINSSIIDLTMNQNIELGSNELLKLSKCYILSQRNNDSDEFLVGETGFIDNIVSDAYAIYEEYKLSLDSRFSSRNEDQKKVRVLCKIIRENGFYE